MITWVLMVILCGGMSGDVTNCEQTVIEHGLTEDECHSLALRLSARHARLAMECVREDHDTIDEDDIETDRSPDVKGDADDI